jgi:hypothetical protein
MEATKLDRVLEKFDSAREIPTPLPGGAVDVLSEMRITSGWRLGRSSHDEMDRAKEMTQGDLLGDMLPTANHYYYGTLGSEGITNPAPLEPISPNAFRVCPVCGGAGFRRSGDFASRTFPKCPTCGGLGQIYLDDKGKK